MKRRQDGKNPFATFVEQLWLRVCRLHVLRGRGRQIGVRKHRAFWKSGRTASVLKSRDGLTQVGERLLYIYLPSFLRSSSNVTCLLSLGTGGDFAVLRHMSAHGRSGRGHLRCVA